MRWFGWFRHCDHWNVRCVHGDEINWLHGKRGVCLDCGRSLSTLPYICTWTSIRHSSIYEKEAKK